jgi:hypothetical protein
VRDTTEATKVNVPPIGFLTETKALHVVEKDVETFFSLATSNDFSDARHKNVHGCDGFAIIVETHVEGFDFLRVVIHCCRTLEVLFSEVAFVFALKIDSPTNGVIKFVT